MQGLEDLRVLELGGMVSAAHATKMLADLGADVIKVEEPSGDRARRRGPFPHGKADPEASGFFLYLNTNKRGVTLDLASASDRARLDDLVAWADLVVHNFPPREMAKRGISYERVQAVNPRAVLCSITPFGLDGPHANYRAEEITLSHGGGWAWLSPGASDRPDLPPLKAFGHQSDLHTGLAALVSSLGAVFRAQQTGRGEHVDLSAQAHVASFTEQNLTYYTYCERIASRLGQRLLFPWGMFECADGLIFLVIVEEDQWKRLLDLMGNPEWASWDIFQGLVARAENQDAMRPFIAEWTKQWKVADLFRAGQEKRICFAPVSKMADIDRSPHLKDRGFVVEVDHPRAGRLRQPGAPYRLSEPWWKVRRPAPLLGEHNVEVLSKPLPKRPAVKPAAVDPSRLPLGGVRVADFSWVWAGPFCAMQLAHLGAEVIRLESESRPDAGRRLPIYPVGMKGGINQSGYFNQWNQGKKSVALNLGQKGAIDIAKRVIAKCDVVVENFATGVMERLGLGFEDLKKIRPDIILASISGYGHTGSQKDYMGYGPAMVPLAGLSSLTGYADGAPKEVGISYGDPTGGITAAAGILAALVARKTTGKGAHVDASLWESTAVLTAEGFLPYVMNGAAPAPMGNRDPVMAPHNCYRAAGEDDWVTIACADDGEFRALCAAMGRPELATDPRFATEPARKANEDALDEEIQSWTMPKDRWEITRILQAAGVAAFPSQSSKDLVADPQLAHRGFFVRLEHPEVGVRTHAGIPWRLAESPGNVRTPAPVLGQHTEEIMRDLLGMSLDEIARLKSEKVLF